MSDTKEQDGFEKVLDTFVRVAWVESLDICTVTSVRDELLALYTEARKDALTPEQARKGLSVHCGCTSCPTIGFCADCKDLHDAFIRIAGGTVE